MLLDLFTLALMTLPGVDCVPFPADPPPALFDSLKRVSGAVELYDPQGSWGKDYGRELVWCRSYVWELQGLPPLCAASGLPSREAACEAVALADRFLLSLEMKRHVLPHRTDELAEVRAEAVWLRDLWWQVGAAQGPTPHYASRRRALAELHATLCGAPLPPAVPVWRLTSLD